AEKRVLDHLRARKPLGSLIGTPGHRSRSHLDATLQTVLSRIQVYCGSVVRHRLMLRYDRPGHHHRRRIGRPRSLICRERLPAIVLWVPAIQRPTPAGLLMLLPDRHQQRRPHLPPRQRAPLGTVAVSWPDLLARAAPWLGR